MRNRIFGNDYSDPRAFGAVQNGLCSFPYRRDELVSTLASYHKGIGAGERTMANIDALRSGYAVVTGQQPALFGGPLYVVYKIATAIRLARELTRSLGVPVVPVFWNASNDSDVSEVDHAYVSQADGSLKRYAAELGRTRLLASIPSDDIAQATAAFIAATGRDDSELRSLFSTTGQGFARDISAYYVRLFAAHGLIALEPMMLNSLAPEFFTRSIASHDAVVKALTERRDMFDANGLPVTIRDIPAVSIFNCADGIRTRVDTAAIDGADVHERASRYVSMHGSTLTCDVFSRIIFQQYAVPALAYVAGPAEFNYLAHAAALSAVFPITMPIIYPRASITVLEAGYARLAAAFGMPDEALFGDYDAFIPIRNAALAAAEHRFSAAAAALMDEIGSHVVSIDKQFERTAEQFYRRLREDTERFIAKAERAQNRAQGRDPAALARLKNYIQPRGEYQERTLTAAEIMQRNGVGFVDRVVDEMTLGATGHQIIRL